VCNDDIVQPRSGFGAHPHRDAEIFSYILDGERAEGARLALLAIVSLQQLRSMPAGLLTKSSHRPPPAPRPPPAAGRPRARAGQLTHADSMGTRGESLGRGGVQFMSAGRGVTHSEMNHHDTPCRFLQVWVTPAQRGLQPQYGSARCVGGCLGLLARLREGTARRGKAQRPGSSRGRACAAHY
jgi:redox-sensitive bicupin YhaK (pirin superfamily)